MDMQRTGHLEPRLEGRDDLAKEDILNAFYKLASVTEDQMNKLVGSKPSDQSRSSSEDAEQPQAGNVLQRLRDLRQQFRQAHQQLYSTSGHIAGHI